MGTPLKLYWDDCLSGGLGKNFLRTLSRFRLGRRLRGVGGIASLDHHCVAPLLSESVTGPQRSQSAKDRSVYHSKDMGSACTLQVRKEGYTPFFPAEEKAPANKRF